jgi:hypothetical protein
MKNGLEGAYVWELISMSARVILVLMDSKR